MSDAVAVVKGIERVQQASGCTRAQAWAALTMCKLDVEGAIELARRMAPMSTTSAVPPSAEVLSMMYPACDERPRDWVKRVKAVQEATGASLRLACNALQMCRADAGEAVLLLA
jgi:hypothetical protein